MQTLRVFKSLADLPGGTEGLTFTVSGKAASGGDKFAGASVFVARQAWEASGPRTPRVFTGLAVNGRSLPGRIQSWARGGLNE